MKKIQLSNIILGIDPGIADTGIGVIRQTGNELSCIFYCSIKTSAKASLPDRLKTLHDELNKIVIEHKPNIVVTEELFFCNNAKTALIVGQARGVILLTIKQHGLDVKEFTPLQVKQAVTAYGKADKQQVQRMVKMILKLELVPKPDDAADALAIAICGANNYHD